MDTFADPDTRAICCKRIARIAPDTPARWGRMNAHQMVCHLRDSFHVATGEKYASPATNLFQRSVIKWIALHTPVSWPHNVPTRPEVEQGRGGTPPGDWERDRAELVAVALAFADRTEFRAHPIFGKMGRSDWMVWAYRHTDHHLRQFG